MTNYCSTASIPSGISFFSGTTSAILGSFNLDSRIEKACEEIKLLLITEKYVDLPLIIEKLNLDVEVAIEAIKRLRKQGFIRFEYE